MVAGGEEFASSVHLAGPLSDTLGLRLTAMYRYLNDTPLAADERITELEGLEIYGANAQLNWSPSPNNRFEFKYSRVQEDRWRDTDTRGSAPFYLSGYDLVRQLAGVRWLPRFGDWYGQVGAYEARTDAVGYRDDGGTPVTPQFMRDRVADFNMTGPLNEDMDLTIGGEARSERLRHRAFAAGQDTANYRALFAQHQWRFVPDWSLTTALRWDEHDSFGSELSPRAYLVWSITPQWVVKGGYGRGFRAPTLKQSSAEYRFEGAHTFVGNPDVGPETSESYELSALYEVNGNLSFSVSVFRNNITDLIATELLEIIPGPSPQRVSTYVNVSRARMDGVEADVTWRPIAGLRLRAGYAWLEGTDLDADQPLTNRPEHRITASAQYSWLQERLSAGIALEYNGRQYLRVGTPSVLTQLPGYTLVNANVRWQMNERHSLVATVNNLTDVDLITKSADFGYAERGRSYALRWSMSF
ncbi:MAG: TonB-dependent receptor [Verrucomicrobia bacterium]|nr:TonB-dependent receptor [Verrucomicrobiota bacterium]